MQEGDGFFRKLMRDTASVVGVDSRPLLLAFAMCAGAAAYLSVPFEPTRLEVAAFFGAVAAMFLLVRWLHRSDLTYALAVCVFGTVIGFSAAALRTWRVEAPVISAETRPVMLEGWVANIEPGEKGARLKIKVHSIAGFPADQQPELVRVTHRARLEVSSGRFVRCWVVLRQPPSPTLPGDYDFRRQAYFQKLGAVGYVQGRCRGGVLGAPDNVMDQAALWVSAQRRLLASYVNEAAGERAGGLAAALIAGDRSFLRTEDQNALRDTGLAHLLARPPSLYRRRADIFPDPAVIGSHRAAGLASARTENSCGRRSDYLRRLSHRLRGKCIDPACFHHGRDCFSGGNF